LTLARLRSRAAIITKAANYNPDGASEPNCDEIEQTMMREATRK